MLVGVEVTCGWIVVCMATCIQLKYNCCINDSVIQCRVTDGMRELQVSPLPLCGWFSDMDGAQLKCQVVVFVYFPRPFFGVSRGGCAIK